MLYILCCVDRVIFHSGLPHFKGGCGGSMVSLVVVSTDVSLDNWPQVCSLLHPLNEDETKAGKALVGEPWFQSLSVSFQNPQTALQ